MDKKTAFQLACRLSTESCIEIVEEIEEKREETKRLLALHKKLFNMGLSEQQKKTLLEYVEVCEDVAGLEMQDAFIAGFMTSFDIFTQRKGEILI